MRWCVIRHPDLGVAVVAEGSLSAHEPRGWVRTSPLVVDQHSLDPADYPLPEPVNAQADAEQSDGDAGQGKPATVGRPTKPTIQNAGS